MKGFSWKIYPCLSDCSTRMSFVMHEFTLTNYINISLSYKRVSVSAYTLTWHDSSKCVEKSGNDDIGDARPDTPDSISKLFYVTVYVLTQLSVLPRRICFYELSPAPSEPRPPWQSGSPLSSRILIHTGTFWINAKGFCYPHHQSARVEMDFSLTELTFLYNTQSD